MMDQSVISKYIESLPAELQEKARACASTNEMLELADKNKLELPPALLELASGGNSSRCEDPATCNHRGGSMSLWNTKQDPTHRFAYSAARCHRCRKTIYIKETINEDIDHDFWDWVEISKAEYDSI